MRGKFAVGIAGGQLQGTARMRLALPLVAAALCCLSVLILRGERDPSSFNDDAYMQVESDIKEKESSEPAHIPEESKKHSTAVVKKPVKQQVVAKPSSSSEAEEGAVLVSEQNEGYLDKEASRNGSAALPVEGLSALSFVQRFSNATLWSDASIDISGTPLNLSVSSIVKSMMMNMPFEDTSKEISHLGVQDAGFIFCEYYSVTYAVWLIECLPRLVTLVESLVNLDHGDGYLQAPSCIPFIIPGEHFVYQYVVEVLGIHDDCVVVLPTHLVWQWAHPRVALTVQTAWLVAERRTVKMGDALSALQRGAERVSVLKGTTWQTAISSSMVTTMAAVTAKSLPPYKPIGCKNPVLVGLSQRLDMTHAHNASGLLTDVCSLLDFCAECFIIRFESLRVAQQVDLASKMDVLLGPPGANMLNLLWMKKGKLVIELLPMGKQSVDIIPKHVKESTPLNHPLYLDEEFQGNATESSTDSESRTTQIQLLARHLDLKFSRVYPTKEVTLRTNPVFSAVDIAKEVNRWASGKEKSPKGESRESFIIGSPMGPCEGLYHLKKTFRLLGLSKDTYLIADRDFALKVANSEANHRANKHASGDWRQVEKEMRLLRNATEARITPALTLCFDNPRPLYAQQRFEKQLGQQGQTYPIPIVNETHWWIALAGYIDVWAAHRERGGKFMFYCDAGPKNWAISFEGTRLQMYDLDETMMILPGTRCNSEKSCGCGESLVATPLNGRVLN